MVKFLGGKMNTKGTINFIEVCNLLKKSKRTISRYIKKGVLNPEKVKNEKRI